MTMDRRSLLKGLITAGAAAPLAQAAGKRPPDAGTAAAPPGAAPQWVKPEPVIPRSPKYADWDSVREQFLISRDYMHFASFLISSHPAPVRASIEAHRRGMDDNPYVYIHKWYGDLEYYVRLAAGSYLGVDVTEICLTDSTTMSLGMLYQGLDLKAGDEILTSEHDHYSTHESLRLKSERSGTVVKKISLFAQPQTASTDEIVGKLVAGIGPKTRAAALTWVHSNTGMKLPVRAIADALAAVNKKRGEKDPVLLCVDGVHGLGIEDVTLPELGCDFFATGCHKSLYGPRGTGLIWSKPSAFPRVTATIPSMSDKRYWGGQVTPGGFHSFEHRWSLREAFEFHQQIGKARVAERVHALAQQCREGLLKMKHVKVHTPPSAALSSGMVCFDVDGLRPQEVVDRLFAKRIIASTTPYDVSYARIAPGLLNTPAEVDAALAAVRALASA